jgi:glutamate synthase (ferredoxin)
VRNSGAIAVVEGIGDHGCEYMTGGKVLILGPTGRNFAAGMSGGVAYVIDPHGDFARYLCNLETVALESDIGFDEMLAIKRLIENHLKQTQSPLARRILDDWTEVQGQFVKVMPEEYKQALERLAKEPESLTGIPGAADHGETNRI